MKNDKNCVFVAILSLLKEFLSVHVVAYLDEQAEETEIIPNEHICILPQLKNRVQEARRYGID